MKIIFFDTETTGLLDFKKAADHPDQPRLCSIAWLVLDQSGFEGDPTAWTIPPIEYRLVKPEGWVVPAEAIQIHGLTNERLQAEGSPVAEVLEHFLLTHDDCQKIAGYGVDHDLKMLRGELRRAEKKDRYGELEKIDVMRMAQKICRLPPTAKMRGGFKPPTLAEAHEIILGEPMADHHNAASDVLATARIYLKLKE